MTIEQIKADARRLGAHIRLKYGRTMSVADTLEALAASKGYRDWNAYSTFLTSKSSASEVPEAIRPNVSREAIEPSLADICAEAIRTGARIAHMTFRNLGCTEAPGRASIKSLNLMVNGRLEPLLIAPTGKAARVLAESRGNPVGSLHAQMFPNPTSSGNNYVVTEGAYEHSTEAGVVPFDWRGIAKTDNGIEETTVVLHVPKQFVGIVRQVTGCAWETSALAATTGIYAVSGTVGCGAVETLQHVAQRAVGAGKKVGYLGVRGSWSRNQVANGICLGEYETLEEFREIGARLLNRDQVNFLVLEECHSPEHLRWIQELMNRGLVVVTYVHSPGAEYTRLRLAQLAKVGGLRDDLMDWVGGIRQQKLVRATNSIGQQVEVEELILDPADLQATPPN